MEGIIRILRYTFYFVKRNNKMQIFHITLGKQTTDNNVLFQLLICYILLLLTLYYFLH